LLQQLIRAIAELSARNNDAALEAVRGRQGFTFCVTPTAQPNPNPANPGANARTAGK
jgi:hypothetical protein